ncbi:hypothetical protein D3C86_1903850 [compost metagenome]
MTVPAALKARPFALTRPARAATLGAERARRLAIRATAVLAGPMVALPPGVALLRLTQSLPCKSSRVRNRAVEAPARFAPPPAASPLTASRM